MHCGSSFVGRPFQADIKPDLQSSPAKQMYLVRRYLASPFHGVMSNKAVSNTLTTSSFAIPETTMLRIFELTTCLALLAAVPVFGQNPLPPVKTVDYDERGAFRVNGKPFF